MRERGRGRERARARTKRERCSRAAASAKAGPTVLIVPSLFLSLFFLLSFYLFFPPHRAREFTRDRKNRNKEFSIGIGAKRVVRDPSLYHALSVKPNAPFAFAVDLFYSVTLSLFPLPPSLIALRLPWNNGRIICSGAVPPGLKGSYEFGECVPPRFSNRPSTFRSRLLSQLFHLPSSTALSLNILFLDCCPSFSRDTRDRTWILNVDLKSCST